MRAKTDRLRFFAAEGRLLKKLHGGVTKLNSYTASRNAGAATAQRPVAFLSPTSPLTSMPVFLGASSMISSKAILLTAASVSLGMAGVTAANAAGAHNPY